MVGKYILRTIARKRVPFRIFLCLYITFSLPFESKKVRDSKVCAACPEFSKQPLHAGRAAVKYPLIQDTFLNPIHTCEYAPRISMSARIL